MSFAALAPLFVLLSELVEGLWSEGQIEQDREIIRQYDNTHGYWKDKHGVTWTKGRNSAWVCKHCSSKKSLYTNDSSRSRCSKCGKLRPGVSA